MALVDPEKRSEWDRQYYIRTREKRLEARARYRNKNRNKILDYMRNYYRENADRIIQYQKRYAVANADKLRVEKRYRRSVRRARMLAATPSWLTTKHKRQIRDVYVQAARNTEDDFVEIYVVDHVVPLQSKRVCGLHVPWNLQILTYGENCSKGNRLLPQDQLVDYSASGYVGTQLEP